MYFKTMQPIQDLACVILLFCDPLLREENIQSCFELGGDSGMKTINLALKQEAELVYAVI